MTLSELAAVAKAVEIMVERSKHHRFTWLCSDENPDIEVRDAYRRQVLALAAGETVTAPAPSASQTAQGWVPPIGGGCGGCH